MQIYFEHSVFLTASRRMAVVKLLMHCVASDIILEIVSCEVFILFRISFISVNDSQFSLISLTMLISQLLQKFKFERYLTIFARVITIHGYQMLSASSFDRSAVYYCSLFH